jgi:hypothetical protein
MSGEIDEETAENVQEELSEAGSDVSKRQRMLAGIQLAVLFFTFITVILLAFRFNYVETILTLRAEANLGWVVEWSFFFGFIAFWLWVAGLFLKWMESSVINGIGAVAFGIADYVGAIDDQEENE